MGKKIIYISYDFGFLSIHAHEIIGNMIKQGYQVSLFIPSDVHLHLNLHDDCKVISIPVVFNSRLIRTINYSIFLIFFLTVEILKTNRPALIYVRQNYMGLPTAILSYLLNIPYFAEINGLVVTTAGSVYGKFGQYVKAWLESLIIRLVDIVIVPSNTIKMRITDRYKVSFKKIYTVPNGFNELMFYPKNTRTSLGRFLKIKENDFIVGFIGSMGEWQGIEILKKAICQVLSRDASIYFLIVGDYTTDSNMKKMRSGDGMGAKDFADFVKANSLDGNVRYHRFVSYESSSDFMNCCDILVAPYTASYREYGGGSPMKLYAYLGCGKPVIISDLGELTDSIALKKNDAAYLISPDDSSALANAILHFRENRKACKYYGEKGINFALKERRWSHSCSKILSICSRYFF